MTRSGLFLLYSLTNEADKRSGLDSMCCIFAFDSCSVEPFNARSNEMLMHVKKAVGQLQIKINLSETNQQFVTFQKKVGVGQVNN